MGVVLIRPIPPSDIGYVAVGRVCRALKQTQLCLERLTDQTESKEVTRGAKDLPLKKRSLAFVCAVLKHHASPGMIDEMIRNLRRMQTEIQDCLRRLETSFYDVDKLQDGFHRELVHATTGSHQSTSSAFTPHDQVTSWLERFGEQNGISERIESEKRAVSPLNLFLEFLFLFSNSNSIRIIASQLPSGRR